MGKIGEDNWFIYYVYSNDHNPPHFHVQSKDGNVHGRFSIQNFEMLDGNITFGIKKIKKFLSKHSDEIMAEWNKFHLNEK